jgi:hypothetical protein
MMLLEVPPVSSGRATVPLPVSHHAVDEKRGGIAGRIVARGDCKAGWPEYEWRFHLPGQAPVMPPTSRPRWDGTNAAGGTLLLVCGEGFGDTIQFTPYSPDAGPR